MPRGRQAVKVIVMLVGPQDTAVEEHRPGTDGAAVSVRVGGALIYINDRDTAESFHATWRSAADQAASLPVRPDPDRARPIWGVTEPVVMMSAGDVPPTHARLERTPGRPACLWVTHGRMVFAVHDRGALRSAAEAFRRTELLAGSVFRPEPELDVRYRAEATVQRLLRPPRRPGVDRAERIAPPARPAPALRPAHDRSR